MEVISVEEPIVAVRISQYPEDKKSEFLILGRSNVGKSSFINTIINRKNLARTSSKPGKTQTLNFYKVNKEFYYLVIRSERDNEDKVESYIIIPAEFV